MPLIELFTLPIRISLLNMRPTIIVALSLVPPLSACAQKDDVYRQFKEYRTALSADPASVVDYFSRRVLAERVNVILESDFPESMQSIEDARVLLHYGQQIEKVHKYAIERSGLDKYELTLYYSGQSTQGLRRIGISYVYQNGQYLIDGFDFYLDSVGEIPAFEVDDFLQSAQD